MQAASCNGAAGTHRSTASGQDSRPGDGETEHLAAKVLERCNVARISVIEVVSHSARVAVEDLACSRFPHSLLRLTA